MNIPRAANGSTGFVGLVEVPTHELHDGSGVTVYVLVDPRFDDVRYVGVTNKSLEQRLKQHLESPTNARTRAWFRDLAGVGMKPQIVKLHRANGDWQIAEMQWIAWFRARGDLLNVDAGGDLVESGTGWDDIKREKQASFSATAESFANCHQPPSCAVSNRGAFDKRARNPRPQVKRKVKINGVVTPESWRQIKGSMRQR